MSTSIRVIVEDGKFRPLEPIDFVEGQEMELMVLTEREQSIIVLGDLVMQSNPAAEEDLDEEALQREIDETYKGPPISDAIIEERREGP